MISDLWFVEGNDAAATLTTYAPPTYGAVEEAAALVDVTDAVYVWLSDIGMAEYFSSFKAEGYETEADILTLTRDDLQGLGVTKQMHLKKILGKAQQQKDEGDKRMTQY